MLYMNIFSKKVQFAAYGQFVLVLLKSASSTQPKIVFFVFLSSVSKA